MNLETILKLAKNPSYIMNEEEQAILEKHLRTSNVKNNNVVKKNNTTVRKHDTTQPEIDAE